MLALVNPTIEEIVESSNAVYNDISAVYVFTNCDFISSGAMDILKIMVENLPDDVFFILTCENLDNIPQAIKNNAVTYMMDTYSDEDKYDFLYSNEIEDLTREDEEFLVETASNLGEVKDMCSLNIGDFKEYVKSTLDVLMSDTPITHEIESKIAFYNESGKFPIRLFWRAFTAICGDKMRTEGNSLMYCRFIAITGDSLQSVIGSNIDLVDEFDSWMAQIREEYTNFTD